MSSHGLGFNNDEDNQGLKEVSPGLPKGLRRSTRTNHVPYPDTCTKASVEGTHIERI